MNAEIRTLNRFEEAGLDPRQSKAMVVGIDDLLVKSAAMFTNRFDAIGHRFDAIGHRFDAIEHRFDSIEHRFESIEHRLESINDSIAHRFSALENSMRFQMIGMIGVIVAILIGFASLFYAVSN